MPNGGRIGPLSLPNAGSASGVWTAAEAQQFAQAGRWPNNFPKTISGLTLWFDASQLTGFNDGDAVTTWPDLSGNGYDVTQGTAGARPLYKVNIFKGQPALLFDGADDGFENTMVNPFTAGAARTVFVVAQSSTAGGGQYICFRRSALVWVYLLSTGLSGLFFSDGLNSASNTTSVQYVGAWGSPHCLTFRAPGAGGQMKVRRNGSNCAVDQGSTPASESGTTGFYIGRREGTNGFMNGHIAELIAYNSELSDAVCLQVEQYLAAKYLDIAT